MTKRMLIDATHPEETRVAVVNGTKLEEYDYETMLRRQLKGNIYLVKVTRVEPSLQAAFVDFGGNRHGFLPFPEIHHDYYRIPIADRAALLAEERALAAAQAAKEDAEDAAELAAAGETLDAEDADQPDVPLGGGVSLAAEDEGEEDIITDLSAAEAEGDVSESDIALAVADAEESETGDAEDGAEESAAPAPRTSIRRHYKIQEVIKRNQIMLIQINKEERGNKGAAVTSYISLPGRYCVLMPNSPRGGGVSRKVSNARDRQRLKQILRELNVPEGMSVILRTAGVARATAEIKRDLDYLLRLWDEIRETTLKSTAPALIYEEGNLIKRAIRDLYRRDIDELMVAGKTGFESARDMMQALMPGHADKVQNYDEGGIPLFTRFQVESQIDAIHSPTVHLKAGGYIVINPTEAMVSIDVNSGRATKGRHIEETALKTNLEAADEIARQLRLRDQGGLVVIDFIDMEDKRNNRIVEKRLRDAMQGDRARIQLGRISAFGLLELSRQRLHPSLVETNFETCTHCAGSGLVRTIETSGVIALRAIEEEGMKARATEIKVALPPEVALYIFNHKREMLAAIEKRHGIRAYLHADASLLKPGYTIEAIRATGEQAPQRAQKFAPVQSVQVSDLSDFDEGEKEGETGVSFVEGGQDRQEGRREGGREGGREGRREGGGRHRHQGRDRGPRQERGGEQRPHHRAERAPDAAVLPAQTIPGAEAPTPAEQGENSEERRNNRRRGRRGGRRRGRGRGDGAAGAPPQGGGATEGPGQPAGSNNHNQNHTHNHTHNHAAAQPRPPVMAEPQPAREQAPQRRPDSQPAAPVNDGGRGQGPGDENRKGWWKRLTE